MRWSEVGGGRRGGTMMRTPPSEEQGAGTESLPNGRRAMELLWELASKVVGIAGVP